MWNRIHKIVVSVALLGILACEPPAEVFITEGDSGVEVTSLVTSDTTFGMSPIDTSALLPGDQLTFRGSLVVNIVRFDAGQGVQAISYARVFIGDNNRPVPGAGGPIGFHGFHLGIVRLNGFPMIERPHRLPGINPVILAGFEYVSGPGFSYVPGQTYTWSGDSVGTSSLAIEAPGIISVQSPAGGSVVNSDQPLQLTWTSDAEISIIVSRIERTGFPRPILQLIPLRNGSALVPAKVLQLLARDQTYVLTFIRANRREVTVARPFLQGTLLVQAASVHNVVVQLR